MKRAHCRIPAVLLAVLVSACTTPTGPGLGDVTSVTYFRDGGFGGIHEEISVGPGSAVKVVRWDTTVTGVLREDETPRLRAALMTAGSWDTLRVTNSCIDCFYHRLIIVGLRRTTTIVADDPGLADAEQGVHDLLQTLDAIRQRLLPPVR